MFNKRKILGAVIAALILSIPAPAGLKKGDKAAVGSGEITGSELVNVLWREPTDIRSRNLFYGGENSPHSTYTFEKEDLDGASHLEIGKVGADDEHQHGRGEGKNQQSGAEASIHVLIERFQRGS
jgi:hypothetical protein